MSLYSRSNVNHVIREHSAVLSVGTPVNSECFGVSDIFNESSDCFQVQGLKITIL